MHLDTTRLDKQPAQPAARLCVDLDQVPRRVRDVAAMRGLGYSYREIGRQLNITPQAVSIMLARHRRKLQSLGSNTGLHQLSARAVNVLGRRGVSSRQEALEKGLLDSLQREPNCGRKTIEEIAAWVRDHN